MKSVEIVYRYEAQDAPAAPRPADADAAQRRLNEGNRAFSTLLDGLTDEGGPVRRIVQVDARDLGLLPGDAKNPEQHPFAAIVGCADARVPIELVFNEGPNDLFVVRVAGNVLGTEILGSLRYAFEHLGGSLRVVAVLGHSGCGAVTAAVDVFLKPANYLAIATSHALRSIIDRLLVVIQASAKVMAEILGPEVVRRPGYRNALIETSILINAALAAHTIQQELGGLDAQSMRAVYGVYLLDTRKIWAPQGVAAESGGLAASPGDLAAFAALGSAVVRSERITSLLMAK
jgi:carbonic anhydrase